MAITLEDIQAIEQCFERVIQRKLEPLQEKINLILSKDKTILNKKQAELLSRDILTISDVAKYELLGRKYTNKTAKKKLEKFVFHSGNNNQYKVPTEAVINYRKNFTIN